MTTLHQPLPTQSQGCRESRHPHREDKRQRGGGNRCCASSQSIIIHLLSPPLPCRLPALWTWTHSSVSGCMPLRFCLPLFTTSFPSPFSSNTTVFPPLFPLCLFPFFLLQRDVIVASPHPPPSLFYSSLPLPPFLSSICPLPPSPFPLFNIPSPVHFPSPSSSFQPPSSTS